MLLSEMHAHQDVLFALEPDGSISGLPNEFQPAFLRVGPVDSTASGSPAPKVSIQLSGISRLLEPCVAQLFEIPAEEQMRLTGSWYHDAAILPPYLSVVLPTHTHSNSLFTGYSLLFDMRTTKLLQLYQVVTTPGDEKRGSYTVSRRVPAYETFCGVPLKQAPQASRP